MIITFYSMWIPNLSIAEMSSDLGLFDWELAKTTSLKKFDS